MDILGGCFDVPLDLCAHTLYTQLVDTKLSNDLNTSLKTICITSIELETVKALCDIFSSYNENYSTTSWAIPLSPMNRLLHQYRDETKKTTKTQAEQQQQSVKSVPFTNNTNLNEANVVRVDTIKDNSNKGKDAQQGQQQVTQKKNNVQNENINTNSAIPSLMSQSELIMPERIVHNNKVTIFNNRVPSENSNSANEESNLNEQKVKQCVNTLPKARTISENSNATQGESSSGSSKTSQTNTTRKVIKRSEIDTCCLFCQKENSADLISCGNQTCKGAYCDTCILKYISNNNSQKCPSCKLLIESNVLANLRDNRSTSSFSASPNMTNIPANLLNRLDFSTSVNLNQNNSNMPNRGPPRNSNHNSYNSVPNNFVNNQNMNLHLHGVKTGYLSGYKHSISDGNFIVNILDEPCDGYETLRSLEIIFDIPSGIQNVRNYHLGKIFKIIT